MKYLPIKNIIRFKDDYYVDRYCQVDKAYLGTASISDTEVDFTITNEWIDNFSISMFWKKHIKNYKEFISVDEVFWDNIFIAKEQIYTPDYIKVNINVKVNDDCDMTNKAMKLFMFGYDHVQKTFDDLTLEEFIDWLYFSDNPIRINGKENQKMKDEGCEHYSKLRNSSFWEKIK